MTFIVPDVVVEKHLVLPRAEARVHEKELAPVALHAARAPVREVVPERERARALRPRGARKERANVAEVLRVVSDNVLIAHLQMSSPSVSVSFFFF